MKIALVGSAPSSVMLTPVHDDSWKIWGCSPGAATSLARHQKRFEKWFELHPLAEVEKLGEGYMNWLRSFSDQQPVFSFESIPGVALNPPYPMEKMVAEFGRYFFTSSIAWMFALAIDSGATEIGLYGIDMSAVEEWGYQRAGCHFFLRECEKRGIKVTVPPQSDLVQPPPLYGHTQGQPMMVKLEARKAELSQRLKAATDAHESSGREMLYLRGAIDDLEYMRNTWAVR